MMFGDTEYVGLEVQIFHAAGTPLEIAQRVRAALAAEFKPDMSSDLEVSIDEHTGGCSVEKCGSEAEAHPQRETA